MTTQGEWNAYIEAAPTREEMKRRGEQVPPEMRDQVRRHIRMVLALRAKANQSSGGSQTDST